MQNKIDFLQYCRNVLAVYPLILLLSLPVIQMRYKVVPISSLAGVEEKMAEMIPFSSRDWLTGKYRRHFTQWFVKKNGFRNFFIRLDNQINFSFFRESKAYGDSIVVGKDNWLFEKSYIKEMNGEQPVNINRMESKISRLKQLQNILESRGIYFLLVIAPSKATIYNEFIAQRHIKMHPVRETGNYIKIKNLLDSNGINYLDGHSFFLQNKKDAPYDLFVKGEPIGVITVRPYSVKT